MEWRGTTRHSGFTYEVSIQGNKGSIKRRAERSFLPVGGSSISSFLNKLFSKEAHISGDEVLFKITGNKRLQRTHIVPLGHEGFPLSLVPDFYDVLLKDKVIRELVFEVRTTRSDMDEDDPLIPSMDTKLAQRQKELETVEVELEAVILSINEWFKDRHDEKVRAVLDKE